MSYKLVFHRLAALRLSHCCAHNKRKPTYLQACPTIVKSLVVKSVLNCM